MKRSSRRKLFFPIAAVALLILIGAIKLYTNRSSYVLPYYARFTPDVDDHWTALGGTWEIADGSMRNDSNDRGAKLLTGLPNWKDYVVEADFQLLGEGSVGVLARVAEAEVGENSFKGYYAGIRRDDNSLALGAFDFAYHEAAKVILPEPVRLFHWYHVKLTVEGCKITATASSAGMREIKTAPLSDPECFRSGRVGLRSNGTGGVWRNVTVSPINSAAVSANSQIQDPSLTKAAILSRPQVVPKKNPALPIQSIVSLLYLAPLGSPVASIRGSVVLIRPAVYVQDATGGSFLPSSR